MQIHRFAFLAFLSACHAEGSIAGAVESPEGPQETSGAQLWSEHCQRCHRMRDPSDLDRDSWNVVMLHMRVRANLTAEESHEILAFLTSGQ
jgi:hypothetical protein